MKWILNLCMWKLVSPIFGVKLYWRSLEMKLIFFLLFFNSWLWDEHRVFSFHAEMFLNGQKKSGNLKSSELYYLRLLTSTYTSDIVKIQTIMRAVGVRKLILVQSVVVLLQKLLLCGSNLMRVRVICKLTTDKTVQLVRLIDQLCFVCCRLFRIIYSQQAR